MVVIPQDSIHTPTIRNVIFGFLQFVDKNDLAMDISFGSSGYSLTLARAFKDVSTVIIINFSDFAETSLIWIALGEQKVS